MSDIAAKLADASLKEQPAKQQQAQQTADESEESEDDRSNEELVKSLRLQLKKLQGEHERLLADHTAVRKDSAWYYDAWNKEKARCLTAREDLLESKHQVQQLQQQVQELQQQLQQQAVPQPAPQQQLQPQYLPVQQYQQAPRWNRGRGGHGGGRGSNNPYFQVAAGLASALNAPPDNRGQKRQFTGSSYQPTVVYQVQPSAPYPQI